MRNVVTVLGVVLGLAVGETLVGAQDYRGRIHGTVADSSAGALPGTTVTLRNDATAVAVVNVTDSDGRYIFDFIEPGMYTIVAELPGFTPAEQHNVRVQQRERLNVD